MTAQTLPSLHTRFSFYSSFVNFLQPNFFICLSVFLCHTRLSLASSDIGFSATPTDLFSNRTGCLYGGRRYKNGAEVPTVERCLRCQCLASNLVCRLRVCSPVPDPPPSGCILLQRANECCRRVVCNQDGAVNENSILEGRSGNGNLIVSQNGPGCFHNGTVYAEGSAMSTSSLCEYCYCIKGQQHCVKPQCLLTMPGCQPVFTKHSCCPTKYNCSNAVSTTTSQPIQQSKGCFINGNHYPEGEMLSNYAKKCESCYCVRGQPRCEPVICSMPSSAKHHCSPVYSDDHCCPTSYKCFQQNSEEILKETRNYISKDKLKDDTVDLAFESKSHITGSKHLLSPKKNESADLKQNVSSSVKTDETTETAPTTMPTTEDFSGTVTTEIMTTEDYTTVSIFEDDGTESSTLDSTTFPTTENEDLFSTTLDTMTPFIPTVIPPSTGKNDTKLSNVESQKNSNETSTTTIKSIPPELEAILNSTKSKEPNEDYDYDYNESSLPPSLPNLRIIPFVAADAVVAKPENSASKYHLPILHGLSKPLLPTTRKPPYYKVSHPNSFSPPTETEGGFLPKEPILDHPLYDGKLDFPFHSVGFNIDITVPPTRDQALSAPSSNLDKMCIHNGKRYSYGDVVSEPMSCDICICYYGEIVCQEPECSPLQPGCTRIHDHSVGCCGRIVCGTNDLDSPTRVIDRVDHVTSVPTSLHTPYSTSNIPAFTVADIVSTPDPFRDVIRTEPAPDLPSLIGEIIHLWDQTTQQYSTSSLPSITTGASEEKVESNSENSFFNSTKSSNNSISNNIDRIDIESGSDNSDLNDNETIFFSSTFHSNKTKARPNNSAHVESNASLDTERLSSTSKNFDSSTKNPKPTQLKPKPELNSPEVLTPNPYESLVRLTTKPVEPVINKSTTKKSSTFEPQHSSTSERDLSISTKTTTSFEISTTALPSINSSNQIQTSTTPVFSSSSKPLASSVMIPTDSSDDTDDSEAEMKNEENDYDNFSFDSMFKFFFDSGTEASETSTSKLPASEVVTTSASPTTSRKPVSLKTPIFPITTHKPSLSSNKTFSTSTKAPATTNRTPVKVSQIKHTYFSSRITAKPVKDIIQNTGTNKNNSNHNNHSEIDIEYKQETNLNLNNSISDTNHSGTTDKSATEKPIIYINRLHSVTTDHKSRNRTVTRLPVGNGTITKTPGSSTFNRAPGTRTPSNGVYGRIPGSGIVTRIPGSLPVTRAPSTTSPRTPSGLVETGASEVRSTSTFQPTTADPNAVTGLLKLAGCNIYGRMYRVGRIISELSGPCLECMCTEVGVQCRPLPC